MFMTIPERPMQSMLKYYYYICVCDYDLQWYKDGVVRAYMPSYHEGSSMTGSAFQCLT